MTDPVYFQESTVSRALAALRPQEMVRTGKAEVSRYLQALAVHSPPLDLKINFALNISLSVVIVFIKPAMLMVSGSFIAAYSRRIGRSELALRKFHRRNRAKP
jgi:hypothetical protein